MGRLVGQLNGQPNYQMGPELAISASSRPIKIKSASTLASNNTEKDARIATADQWAQVPDKSRTGIFVEDLFYDNGFPTGIVYVSPMPSSGQIVLWVFQAIPQLPAQTGTINLAPGYEQAILTIAAVDLVHRVPASGHPGTGGFRCPIEGRNRPTERGSIRRPRCLRPQGPIPI